MRFGARRAASNTGRITWPERYTTSSRSWRYCSKSAIGRSATPVSIAARATAGATTRISRGSNGFGMMYSGPNTGASPP